MGNKVLVQPHHINQTGWEYYNKMRRETKKAAFVSGPLLLLFFNFCTALIVGWNIYTLYILIFPFASVTLFSYFIPLVIRGKYINAMAKNLQVKENSIVVETFEWFFLEPKYLQINSYNVIFKHNSSDIPNFPANMKLSLSKNGKTHHVYLIRDFFDNWEEIMQQLKAITSLRDNLSI